MIDLERLRVDGDLVHLSGHLHGHELVSDVGPRGFGVPLCGIAHPCAPSAQGDQVIARLHLQGTVGLAYVDLLVAAKYARVLNEFPRDRSSSREKKLTTRAMEELSRGDVDYKVTRRRPE